MLRASQIPREITCPDAITSFEEEESHPSEAGAAAGQKGVVAERADDEPQVAVDCMATQARAAG